MDNAAKAMQEAIASELTATTAPQLFGAVMQCLRQVRLHQRRLCITLYIVELSLSALIRGGCSAVSKPSQNAAKAEARLALSVARAGQLAARALR